MVPKQFMIVAGEPSGDLLAADLVRALREELAARDADPRDEAIGGEQIVLTALVDDPNIAVPLSLAIGQNGVDLVALDMDRILSFMFVLLPKVGAALLALDGERRQ